MPDIVHAKLKELIEGFLIRFQEILDLGRNPMGRIVFQLIGIQLNSENHHFTVVR
ncbi:MAG: hypothetical protein AB2565_03680 [Candidatus Thiodiazotropha endolucinida]